MSIFTNSRGKFLKKYGLVVGSCHEYYNEFSREMELKSIVCDDIDICGEPNWLLSSVERLGIHRCNNVRSLNDISGFQDATYLRFIEIEGCDGVEFVLSWPWLNPLQNLEQLHLSKLVNLNALLGELGVFAKSTPLPAATFSSLEYINVVECHQIKKLFSVRWLRYLQNLEAINVDNCENMEEIIWSDYEEGEKALGKVTLPKLQSLELMDLPHLKSIYSDSSTVLICKSIEEIRIERCPKVYSFLVRVEPLPTPEYLNLFYLENLKSVFDEEALDLSPPLSPTTFFSLKEGILVWMAARLLPISRDYSRSMLFANGGADIVIGISRRKSHSTNVTLVGIDRMACIEEHLQ